MYVHVHVLPEVHVHRLFYESTTTVHLMITIVLPEVKNTRTCTLQRSCTFVPSYEGTYTTRTTTLYFRRRYYSALAKLQRRPVHPSAPVLIFYHSTDLLCFACYAFDRRLPPCTAECSNIVHLFRGHSRSRVWYNLRSFLLVEISSANDRVYMQVQAGSTCRYDRHWFLITNITI